MRTLLFSLVMFCSLAASAASYRWVDENGKVHYGDQPPVGATRLKGPPPPADPPAERKAPTNAPAPTPGKGVYKEATYAEICSELKARIATYRSQEAMAVADENGNARILSADEREALISKTQSQADAACDKASQQP